MTQTQPHNIIKTILQLQLNRLEKQNRKYKQVTIDDPLSKYYSSDEQASESDDDLN